MKNCKLTSLVRAMTGKINVRTNADSFRNVVIKDPKYLLYFYFIIFFVFFSVVFIANGILYY